MQILLKLSTIEMLLYIFLFVSLIWINGDILLVVSNKLVQIEYF